jgi:hypothetical protein
MIQYDESDWPIYIGLTVAIVVTALGLALALSI